MAQTKATIISNAITQLGHAPISSLEEQDDLVLAAEQAYDLLLPSILTQNNWRFATQIQQLSLSNETPPDPWQGVYLLPAGYLKTIRVYPLQYSWDIYADEKIYSMGTDKFWLEYTFQPDPSRIPAVFSHYFCYEIAAYLMLSNAERPDYYNVIAAERTRLFAMCSGTLIQNRPQITQASFPVLNQRQVSAFDGNTGSW